MPIPIAARRHLVQAQNPAGPAVADGDGGFTQLWTDLAPPTLYVKIAPATAKDLERVAGGTVLATATHIVTGPFHPDVTTETRLTKGPRNADGTLATGSRQFNVTGKSDVEERQIEMVLVCVEVVR